LAKTIYNYWFVQFDFPNAEGKPYKTSGGEMEWNEELKREIPKGWEVQKIGEYADVRKGDLITAKDANDGEIKVVAAGIDFSYTHTEFNRERNTITISGSGANAGFINFWREPIFASDCITVRGNTDTETLQLLYYLKFIQSHILQKATGSAQPHVYPDDIKNLYYAIPNYSTIEKFGVAIIPLNELIATCIKQNNELIKLRDFLLPLLMNGQVKIKSEAKEQLSMAAEPQVKYGK
ncbi:MAG: restriction endonuclease subunit S, partial [Chitinophagales bacterium]|nr:restriction endonuclease subunit S [Chitinophagales bacterium]